MTTEREVYLAKCSERELLLRNEIDVCKNRLMIWKSGKLPRGENGKHYKKIIKSIKYKLTAYRHELARLKGMDRVVVPRMAYIGFYGDKGGLCKCGKYVTDSYIYCSECGRRILWEKVK